MLKRYKMYYNEAVGKIEMIGESGSEVKNVSGRGRKKDVKALQNVL
ncbi:hypothetical protein PZH33_23695 [Blautia schinkii]|nr:hypothetical protein [Blautia schinkii]MDE8682919.1 hypothetical protein [Blautia schinkii]